MTKFVSESKKPSKWTNLRELYETSDVTRTSGDFRISPSIDKVQHVFIHAQREKTNIMTENPYIANSSIVTCRLEYGNGVFYPEYPYESESKSRIFSDLMNYSWQKNDYNKGTQLSIANFSSIYPIIYFDLTYKEEKPTRDPIKLTLKNTVNVAATAYFRLHAIAFYEEDVVIDKVGDKLFIV